MTFTDSRVLDIPSVKLYPKGVRGATKIRYILATDEIKTLSFLVDDLVREEKDEEKVWDACGHCLLKTVDSLKGIFPMLKKARLAQSTDGQD